MASHIVRTSKTIRAPVSNVLAVVHDPVKLIRLNPLVIDATQSSTDPNSYTITDKMTVLGTFSLTTQYTARFTMTDDGVDVTVRASSGGSTVRMTNQWRIKALGDGSAEVTETVLTLEANPLLKPYVIYTLRKSHKELLETMRKELEDPNETSSFTMSAKLWRLQMTAMMTLGVLVLYSFFLSDNGATSGKTCIMVAFILLIISFAAQKIRTSDPYGSFHLAFNIPLGANPNAYPDTEWLNMGYWKNTQSFPQACEALALKLVDAAKCIPGGHVLDVGHACGDSLLLQMSHPDVPRPALLTGITSLPFHHTRSQKRIARLQSVRAQSCEVALFCGDAILRSEDTNHPLHPSSSIPQFSTVLALDCAYHFATRELFLRQSFARLLPGGSIALADLAVSDPLPFPLRTVMSKILSVHPENMITPRMYEAQLKAIGYINIHITDISDDVFPGFRMFLKSRGGLWRLFELVIGWWVQAGGRFLIVSASKSVTLVESDTRSY